MTGCIQVCGLDGSDCLVLAKSLAVHPFDLAVYQDYLFFTDWVLQAVVRIDKLSGEWCRQTNLLRAISQTLPTFLRFYTKANISKR